MRRTLVLSIALMGFGCGSEEQAAAPEVAGEADLPIGDSPSDDGKADGTWGAALTCKPVPNLPALANPRIVVSLNGQTVHLFDATSGYDRVFAAGVGAIETQQSASSFGESKSYYPIIATGGNDFTITPSSIQPCKTWWTDPETGAKSPVFAGLPFLAWFGGYALHGPIDNYKAPNGGNLRRGFVSHGCIRMESADVLELYARIKGVARVPVHVQREPERDALGERVDLPSRWIGAECQGDDDCGYASGFCKLNRFSGRGFCSAHCTSTCADRAGYPTTMCVADPDNSAEGICVSRVVAQNTGCRSGDHLVPRTQSRFHQASVSATVCVPGTPGWVGDHCFASGDCQTGNQCVGASAGQFGICTQSCVRACPDQPGSPWTFCTSDPALGSSPTCMRQCTPASNASECPADSQCSPHTRAGGGVSKNVCVPR